MNVIERLNWRYATKAFDQSRKISDRDFEILQESLRLSPSSFGLQPWKFIIVNDKNRRQKLREQAWGQPQITDASHLIVLCALKDMDEKYVEEYIDFISRARNTDKSKLQDYKKMMTGFIKNLSKEELKSWMKRQVYIALGTLMTTAAVMDIDSCPMEGFNNKDFDKVLELDKYGVESLVLCALGYRSKDDDYAKLKKVRYPSDKVLIKL